MPSSSGDCALASTSQPAGAVDAPAARRSTTTETTVARATWLGDSSGEAAQSNACGHSSFEKQEGACAQTCRSGT